MPVVNFFIGVQYEQTQAALYQAETAQDLPSIVTVHKQKKPVEATTTPQEIPVVEK